MKRRFVATIAILMLPAALVACGGRAPFDDERFSGSGFSEVERTLTDGALELCAQRTDPDGLANQAVATRTFVVALSCEATGDDSVRLVVDRFDDVDHRDGAARHFESLLRPRGDGAVWTLGPFTLFANGGRNDDVMDRLATTLDDAGAE